MKTSTETIRSTIEEEDMSSRLESASIRAAARWAIIVSHDEFALAASRFDGGEEFHPILGNIIKSTS